MIAYVSMYLCIYVSMKLSFICVSGRKPSSVEERSESIVNKLQVLDQRLASKVFVTLVILFVFKCMVYVQVYIVGSNLCSIDGEKCVQICMFSCRALT